MLGYILVSVIAWLSIAGANWYHGFDLTISRVLFISLFSLMPFVQVIVILVAVLMVVDQVLDEDFFSKVVLKGRE